MELEDLKGIKTIFGISVLVVLAEDLWQIYQISSFIAEDGPQQSLAQVFPDPLLLIILSIVATISMAYIYYRRQEN